MKLVPTLIVRDILVVTVVAVLAVSGLLSIAGFMFEGGKTGLDPLSVLSLLPYIIAPSLPFTIPTCLLLATTYVLGTMGGNNELIAIKASGINVMRLVRPVILLAVLTSICCVLLADRVIPWCERQVRLVLLDDIEATLFTYLRQKHCIVGPEFPYELYVKSIDGQKLINPTIKHRSEGVGYDLVLQAREATLQVGTNPSGQMELFIRLVDGALSTDPGNSVYFLDRTERLPLPEFGLSQSSGVADQDFQGLEEQFQRYKRLEQEAEYEAAIVMTTAVFGGDPTLAADMAKPIDEKIHAARQQAYRSWCEKHQRIARSASALPFILLGAPISILVRRKDFLQTFFICFLPIVTLYYPTLILTFNMLKEMQSEAFYVFWIPAILMILVSLPIIRRVVQY